VVNVRFASPEDGEGVSASSPLMGFDKNDIMRAVELGVLALVAILILFFVLRPLIRSATSGGGGTALIPSGGGVTTVTTRVVTMPDGQQMTVDAATGQPLALPAPEIDHKIDLARIEGQVKASSVKRVSEFVEKHPEESVSIIRNWLHESA
jgi:flagellar M-ring protein FliF